MTFSKFEDLEIWRLARELCKTIFVITSKNGFEKDFRFRDQIRASSGSVMDNIAELNEQGCIGAPDLVVEILSPGNTRREMKDNLELYQAAGVPEYWVVDPEHEFIIVYTCNEAGAYVGSIPYTDGDMPTTPIMPGLQLDVTSIFATPARPASGQP